MALANGVEIEMEDPRCKIAALKARNSDSYNLLDGVTVGIEDARCSSLQLSMAGGIEDPRYARQDIQMEDPRCVGMFRSW